MATEYDFNLTPRQNIAPELHALAEELAILINARTDPVIEMLEQYLTKVLDIGFCGEGCTGHGCTYCEKYDNGSQT